jgi:hypothetical protein
VRVDLALIVCGNRICEVITATLGPLPLDQLPKSKPVTPYAVFTDDTHRRTAATRPAVQVDPSPGENISLRCGIPYTQEKPLRALAVAEDAPAGV